MNPKKIVILCLSWLSVNALSFESTQVLPEGVRNFNLRTVYTETDSKTDKQGQIKPLAIDLWKPLKFKNIISGETGLKKKQLEGLLIQQGWSPEDSVGDFYANLDAQISVWAPIFAYGVTSKLTIATALPIYSASTDISVGFKSNSGADKFIGALTDSKMSNYQSAVEAARKMSEAPSRLNTKLVDNGYQQLDKWQDTGLGDLQVIAKYLAYDGEVFKTTVSGGFVAPTGKTDDPAILTDLPFGDGQWDLISQVILDQDITPQLKINQFYKYTYQAPGNKETRLKTAEESIEVELKEIDYKLGDKVDAGLSIQYEQASTGIQGGLGVIAFRKFSDTYETEDLASKSELEKDSTQEALYWAAKLGYSTVKAYGRGEFAAPLMASIEYRKQQESKNQPRTDFTQIDLKLFF